MKFSVILRTLTSVKMVGELKQHYAAKSCMSVSVWRSVITAWSLCSLVACGLGAEEEVAPPSPQEALGLLAALQQPSEPSSNELRKIANLYELLQQFNMQQQNQRVQLADLEERVREREEGGGEELPVPLPLQSHIAALDRNDYLKDKRGSYMSLCHFKICNMGRKRSSYWNTWGRN